jgi:hypothetical protein
MLTWISHTVDLLPLGLSHHGFSGGLLSDSFLQMPVELFGEAVRFNEDVMGGASKAFKTFVESGQVYALVIGLVIGYMFRSLTTYN